ncbi:MAG: DUF2341 domain-containing protein [Fibrobacterota bacterium]|nr:MAG: DUF2341 domain-containing protein [Fibrobacterota bacterium]
MKSRLLGLFTLALWGCDSDRVAGGTSSEVPNALHGSVVDSRGEPAARCLVTRTAASSTADSAFAAETTWTDSHGRWAFPIRSGRWTLLFQHANEMAYAEDPSTSDAPLRLSSGGWLAGRVAKGFSKGRVFLKGTGLWAPSDSSGAFLLGPLPAGDLPIVVKADSAGVERSVHETARVQSAEVRTTGTWFSTEFGGEDYSMWPYARLAMVDLTSQGAAVEGDQALFPVPVRLDSVLDLATTRAQDIRFDDERGNHLPFFVQEWNASANRALVWVRLDTANGNSSKHFLRLHWGRRSAAPTGMPGVFSDENGFAGAWGAASEADAGTVAIHWTSDASEDGPVGQARSTGDASKWMSDSVWLGGSTSWTVSMWVKLHEKPSGEVMLAGFDTGVDSSRWGLSVRDDRTIRVWSGADPSKDILYATPMPIGEWVHLAATFDAATKRIGLVVGTEVVNRRTVAFPVASKQPLVGAVGLRGALDELRFSTEAREGSWSQLETRTQSPSVQWLRWQ